jgi:predicted SprT family Zn-dependent metalloprotease
MTNKTIRELIRFACECNDCPQVAKLIRFEWSNRMTTAMGNAKGCNATGYLIKLSTKLFTRANEEEQRETVIHEVCHVVDRFVNKGRMSHGEGWKVAMRHTGLEPRRCHKVTTLVKRFIYACPNDCFDYKLSTRMHNSINKGDLRICIKCRRDISFTGQVEGV